MATAEQTAWYDVLGRFQQAANAFDATYKQLVNTPEPDSAALAEEKRALLDRADTIYNTVNSIQSALTDVKMWLSGAGDAITGAWDWVKTEMGLNGYDEGLGFPPLIPIAIVAASLVTIASFLSDVSKYNKRMAAYNTAIASGATPDAAANAVARVSTAGTGGTLDTLSDTTKTVAWIAAGVAALFFLSKAMKK